MDRVALLWLVPLAPFCFGALAYLALRRQWHVWWLTLFAFGYSTVFWLGAFVVIYVSGYRQPSFLAPFLTALLTCPFVVLFIHFKVRSLVEKGKLSTSNIAAPQYLFTTVTTLAILVPGLVLSLIDDYNERFLLAIVVLSLVLGLVFFFFERSQYKSKKWPSH